MTDLFHFEADFVDSLRCIPMVVRLKLDTCGIKLKLAHWYQLTPAERQQLVDLPCATGPEIDWYRTRLSALLLERTGTPAMLVEATPLWLAPTVPETVQAQAKHLGVAIHQEQWATLTPLQRFALLKLSRASHENQNFLPALREFGLVPCSEPEF
ncbi:nitrate reductase associated protein [Anthocerotibacter panamensis]|uniref:nitrate reductase associated protein n=1 Tax=Anthocerotibacter panamensis TaxID=2857077 RepID=UPI001C40176E|nr:nitrate reductase associated protein [Anthocerotibacter panamensis]